MDKRRQLLGSPNGIAALLAVCAFVVYLNTMAPTVDFIDSGELAAVASTLGIAHPTGYPLFTLLGWVFSKLPIAAEEVTRLNIMAAFFCSAGVFIFFHLVRFVLVVVVKRASVIKFKGEETARSAIRASGAGAALLLAFSETYWSQAVAVEVYSLHVVFLSLVTYSFLRAIYSESPSSGWWYLFAFTLGLAFTNHMTTVLLAPGFVYLYFATQGISASSWKRIGTMALPFVLGLSVYLYLPIRAAQGPAMNWGNPATLEKFLWHFSGKQYRVWIFSSTEAAGRQFTYFMEALPAELAYVGVALAIGGAWILWSAHRKLFIFAVLLFLTCLLYSINYDIHDIDSYFLLAYFTMALLSGVALVYALARTVDKSAFRTAAIAAVVVGLLPLALHYKTNDRSKHHLVEDYTMNMFASFQPNAFVLSYQWDFWVSASFYYQLVRNYRTDVVVVDKELLRRSWYIISLGRRYPWLIGQSRAEVDAFLKELYKFEHDLPYNANVIEARYAEMIRSFIERCRPTRPVYSTGEIEPQYVQGYKLVPEGLAYRLHADTLFHPTEFPAFRYRPNPRNGQYEDKIRTFYAASLTSRGEYYMSVGDGAEAKKAFLAALQYVPGHPRAQEWLKRLGG